MRCWLSGTSLRLGLVLIALAAWGISACRAATMTYVGKEKDEFGSDVAHVSLEGEIAVGDLGRLKKLLAEKRLEPRDGFLSLSSPGGSFAEAIRVAGFVREKNFQTRVSAERSCVSACAIIFLGGSKSGEEGLSSNSRALQKTANVGFHAPFVTLPDGIYRAADIEKAKADVEQAYDRSMRDSADLMRLADNVGLSKKLLPLILEKGRRDFLRIDTVDIAGRFDARIDGITPPERLNVYHLQNYCDNARAWNSEVPFDRRGELKIVTPTGLKLNNSITYNDAVRGLPRAVNYVSASRQAVGGSKETFYVLPTHHGGEGTISFCAFKISAAKDGSTETSCEGFYDDETVEQAGEVLKRVMAERGSDSTCQILPVFAYAPGDTPIRNLDVALSALELRSNPSPIGGRQNVGATGRSGSAPAPAGAAGSVSVRLDANAPGSAGRAFAVFENSDVGGEELRRVQGIGGPECSSACEGEAKCAAYTYNKWNRWCFLKAKLGLLRLEPSATVGVRKTLPSPLRAAGESRIFRYRTRSFPGEAYRRLSSSSYELCEQSCIDEQRCIAVSFVREGGDCRLFATATEYLVDAAVDSGVKRQSVEPH